MIDNTRVLAVIPARSGSKRIPNKNLVCLNGISLLERAVNVALRSKHIDRLIVSTDCEVIARRGREAGADVPFLRPQQLSSDETPGSAPIVHALRSIPGYKIVVCLQCTSPFRLPLDIDNALELLASENGDSVVSVTPVRENPHWMSVINTKGRLEPLISGVGYFRSQDLPPAYILNGAIYAAQVSYFLEHETFSSQPIPYVMPHDRSLDIDDLQDLEEAEYRLRVCPELEPMRLRTNPSV